FSATMPSEIAQLAKVMLRNPVTVAVTPAATTVELIAQRAIRAERNQKPPLLAALLREDGVQRALVFTRTKHGADKVVRGLAHDGIAAQAIHGNKTQGARERTMAAFRTGDIRVLIATDIAARGIDVEGVSHVVNYDLPNVPETYVHRIGRTARAGASGIAISLVSGEEMPLLRDIEKTIRQKVPFSGEAPAVATGEGEAGHDHDQRRSSQGRGRNRQRQRDDRPRHGEQNRQHHGQQQGKSRGRHVDQNHQGQRHEGQRHGKGQPHQHANGPSRHHNGGNIGEVGFMAQRPRRGGMVQGSAR
ncbi:MAG TPA: DEAD/DEAH box helicase, partial [Bauldia sp.]|nr:DEAD/DEAH box helicase [Bauldia sp.]